MKVDMSPEAIRGRMLAMEQLWVLSVKLMKSNSKKSRPKRAVEIYDSIRQVLLRDWDPIGVDGVPEAKDEYDSYIPRVYRILVGTRSDKDLIDCLRNIESNEMGGASRMPESRHIAAKKLLELKVMLD